MSTDIPGIIKLTEDNMEKEHICCAISDKKCQQGVRMKKDWLKSRLEEGLVFKKLDARGKVFIEYIPADYAWAAVEAPGYMFVNCFWVSGSFKGQGHGSKLYNECLEDSRDMNGIVVLTSRNKRPFLSDKSFFIKKGFEVCDTAAPYFELLVKRFKEDAPMPKFKDCARSGNIDKKDGLVVFYTRQCPFTDYYVEELLEAAKENKLKAEAIRINSREEAQNAPSPMATHSVFLNGSFLTHEILNKGRFEKLLKSGQDGSSALSD